MVRLAIIGAGNRGMEVYGELALEYDDVQVVSVVEPDDFKRAECAKRHNISSELCFRDCNAFFKKDQCADAVIIANQDQAHFETAKRAITKGYSILLEKPMAVSVAEIKELARLGRDYPDRVLMVCHVLRYAPFFQELKRVLDTNQIGQIITVQHNENIGYYHFAHSYVRGNWRKVSESSPLIFAKSCHDMDILLWLINSKCQSIAAFGGLSYFRKENAPDYAAPRCRDCRANKDCPYSAYQIYQISTEWPGLVVAPSQSDEELQRNLAGGPYGRCVYYCDNDTIDHLSTAIEFENGVSAVFNLSAFTTNISRTIKIMGSHGEIRGDMFKNEIELSIFGKGKEVIIPEVVASGHGGGDSRLFEDFVRCLQQCNQESLTAVGRAVDSHLMAFAAEKSRITKRVVMMEEI
jgi:predicted dehydrogenase